MKGSFMKRTTVTVFVAFAVSGVAYAQSSGMKGMDMKDMDMKGMDKMQSDKKGQAQVHNGTGTVSKVDKTKGSITIAHGPVASMNWPAMSMSFKVKDKALLDKAKQGDKVDFSFVQSGKDYVVTQIK
jgi:Cu(I)/Ag(I) efflux system protein CusF